MGCIVSAGTAGITTDNIEVRGTDTGVGGILMYCSVHS